MKKTTTVLFTAIMSFFCLNSYSQWIDAITVSPPNPTSSDTVLVIADVSFPTGSCSEKTLAHTVAGPVIGASALHCLGVLTFICSDVDTFKIDPLPAGTYIFALQLDAGSLPAPCTPGIAPGALDTITFVVLPSTGINEPNAGGYMVFPNPSSENIQLNLKNETALPVHFEIYSLDGKLIQRQQVGTRNEIIDVSGLANGSYVIRVLGKREELLFDERIEVIR